MKNVVYFFGAGFSSPIGLPVIGNFLFKSREQYCSNSDKFPQFKLVFDYIDSLSKAKNFINIDLFNIEEIFSIADVHGLLGHDKKDLLEGFIKDVIKYHTPNFRLNDSFEVGQNIERLFWDDILRYYLSFVAALLYIIFIQKEVSSKDFVTETAPSKDVDYKIITLNYNTVIEDAIDFINNNFCASYNLPIAKLHGSVDDKIVPPTWNKTYISGIENAWRNAAEWLSKANEIRILGYSLPKTDINIKHLLGTSLVESVGLQHIDVICHDSGGLVKQRYDELFCFPNYNFFNGDILNYLRFFYGRPSSSPPYRTNFFDPEKCHTNWLSWIVKS